MAWSRGGATRTSTTEHRRWRTAVLTRDNHTCQVRDPGCTGAGTEADHVIPVAEGGAPLDVANGQAICTPCHKTKTQHEAARGRRLRIRTPRPHHGLDGCGGTRSRISPPTGGIASDSVYETPIWAWGTHA